METTAYFDDIHVHIIEELGRAKSDITIAVAWFTDPDIFNALCQRASQKVPVKLAILDDDINQNSKLNFQRLKECGGEVFFIPINESGNSKFGNIMHHKFCVLDRHTVITGSFNWSRRARENNEDIVIVADSPEFAIQYLVNFNQILISNGYQAKDIPRVDSEAIVKRLELINNLLALGDYDDVKTQLRKLRQIPLDDNLSPIIGLLERQEFDSASKRIANYITRLRAITAYRSPETESLKQELTILEFQLTALSDRKVEIESQINGFLSQHHHRLGALLLRYQSLRLLKAKKRVEEVRKKLTEDDKNSETYKRMEEEYSEARDEYERYHKHFEEQKETKSLPELSPEMKVEITRLYKKASMLCHPDRVADDRKEEAHFIFSELSDAYRARDLDAVRQMLERLEQGEVFPDRAATLSESNQLRRAISELRQKIMQLRDELNILIVSETWRTISKAGDWDIYFKDKEAQLQAEIAELEKVVTDDKA